MTDLDILDSLITPTARISVEESFGKGTIQLTEPDCSDSNVVINGLPINAIVIKVDNFQAPKTVFKGTQGECKRADYAIIAEKNGRTVIVYVEMKRTKAPYHDIVKQLAGAKCFIKYCQEIGKTFWDESGFLSSACHRFVSIAHTSISKKPTRVDRFDARHDCPERMMKIHHPRKLQFNMLTGAIY